MNCRHRLATLTLALLLAAASATATPLDCVDYDDYVNLVGETQISGHGETVTIDGDIAYIGTSAQMLVMDVSDPTAPVELAAFGAEGSRWLTLDGNLAYVTYARGTDVVLEPSGLQIFDVADPAAPVLLGELAAEPFEILSPSALVGGHYLYVGTYFSLKIYDVADPSAPVLAADLTAFDHGFSILVNGNVAYLGGHDHTLRALDVSNPLAPVLLATVGMADFPYAMARAGTVLYATGYTVVNGSLMSFDVSTPAQPSALSNLPIGGYPHDLVIEGGRALIANGGVAVVDISDPAAMVSLGTVGLSQRSRGIGLHGEQALVSAYNSAYNATSSTLSTIFAAPTFVPMESHDFDTAADKIVIEGRTAYLAAGPDDLVIADLSDSATPVTLSQTALPGEARDLVLQGDLAYIAAFDGGLQIANVADPASPWLVGGLVLPDEAIAIALGDGVAFLSLQNGPVVSVDTSDPTLPVLLDATAVNLWAQDLALAGGILYCAEGVSLWIVDVSDPNALQPLNYDPLADGWPGAHRVEVVGDLLVRLKSWNWDDLFGGSLSVLDISDPTTPQSIGSVSIGYSGHYDLAVRDGSVYVASGGLTAYDISDPANPRVTGAFGGYLADAVAAAPDLLVTSDRHASAPHALGIGPLNCGAITAVEPVDATPAPALLTAYPNPFNPKTRVRFVQPADGPARVTVHGVDGRLLRTLFDATLPAGEHHAEWDGRDDAGHAMSSGVYFLRFEGAGASAGAKLVMLR